jgi:hypothetical protein
MSRVLFGSKYYILKEYEDAAKRLMAFGEQDIEERVIAFKMAVRACITAIVVKTIRSSLMYNGIDHTSFTRRLVDKSTCVSLLQCLSSIENHDLLHDSGIINSSGEADHVDVCWAMQSLLGGKFSIYDKVPRCFTFLPSSPYALLSSNRCSAARFYKYMRKNGVWGTPVFLTRRLAILLLVQMGVLDLCGEGFRASIDENIMNCAEAVIDNYNAFTPIESNKMSDLMDYRMANDIVHEMVERIVPTADCSRRAKYHSKFVL